MRTTVVTRIIAPMKAVHSQRSAPFQFHAFNLTVRHFACRTQRAQFYRFSRVDLCYSGPLYAHFDPAQAGLPRRHRLVEDLLTSRLRHGASHHHPIQ